MKSLIYLKTAASNVPTVFSIHNGDIANTFNDYIKYSHKHFSDLES